MQKKMSTGQRTGAAQFLHFNA